MASSKFAKEVSKSLPRWHTFTVATLPFGCLQNFQQDELFYQNEDPGVSGCSVHCVDKQVPVANESLSFSFQQAVGMAVWGRRKRLQKKNL